VTALSDGVLAAPLDVVLAMNGPRPSGRGQEGRDKHFGDAFLLKLDGKGRWSIPAPQHHGPTLGKLPDNLRRSGVPPEKIETIFLLICIPTIPTALVDDAGRAVYPNAEVILHETEAGSGSTATKRAVRSEPSAATSPSRGDDGALSQAHAHRVRDGEAVPGVPGVSAVLLAGHTPGHTGWLIQSGQEGLLIWGDVVHLAAIQIPRPVHRSGLRRRSQAACATRQRMFDRVARTS